MDFAEKRTATHPAPAARLVLTITLLIVTASTEPLSTSIEPPLNPNQPNHRIKTPRVTSGTFEGGVDLTLPSSRNLPRRAPTTITPASAAHPPVEWTMVEPAKSLKPSLVSQPPPHVHAPITG